MDLEHHRLPSSLRSLYLVSEYISEEEEQVLLREIGAGRQAWRTVSGRRLQNWGGVVHKAGLIPAPLPSWLRRITDKISAETGIYGHQAGTEQPLQASRGGQGVCLQLPPLACSYFLFFS